MEAQTRPVVSRPYWTVAGETIEALLQPPVTLLDEARFRDEQGWTLDTLPVVLDHAKMRLVEQQNDLRKDSGEDPAVELAFNVAVDAVTAARYMIDSAVINPQEPKRQAHIETSHDLLLGLLLLIGATFVSKED